MQPVQMRQDRSTLMTDLKQFSTKYLKNVLHTLHPVENVEGKMMRLIKAELERRKEEPMKDP